jgi:hypothetical protein
VRLIFFEIDGRSINLQIWLDTLEYISGNGPTLCVVVSVGVHSHTCSSAAFTNFPVQDYLRVSSVLCCMEEQDLMC